jgi:hypothetical protein
MRYVEGKIKKTTDNEWVFIYRMNSKTAERTLSKVKQISLTPTDLEVVNFHAEDLKTSHNMDYEGETIKAEIVEMWSNIDGKYSKIRPSDAYLPFSQKKMFAKLKYQQDEGEN